MLVSKRERRRSWYRTKPGKWLDPFIQIFRLSERATSLPTVSEGPEELGSLSYGCVRALWMSTFQLGKRKVYKEVTLSPYRSRSPRVSISSAYDDKTSNARGHCDWLSFLWVPDSGRIEVRGLREFERRLLSGLGGVRCHLRQNEGHLSSTTNPYDISCFRSAFV